ncbi:MAG: NADPH-dependent FMN reductase [Thermomicrobiales bacterium]
MIDVNGRAPQDRPLRILGIGGGSTRGQSISRIALEAGLALAEEQGAHAVMADVRSLELPVYAGDRPFEDYPPSLPWLLDEVRAADAYILCSPTFHGTVSGGVKNALDMLEYMRNDPPATRYFAGKPVGLMALGASAHGGGAWNVINALHHSARSLNGISVPTVVTIPNEAIDRETRTIRDDAIRARMQAMTTEVIDLARRLRRSPAIVDIVEREIAGSL